MKLLLAVLLALLLSGCAMSIPATVHIVKIVVPSQRPLGGRR